MAGALCALAAFGAHAVGGVAAPPDGSASSALGSGIDRSSWDPHVRMQDDLFLAANGQWIARTEIPADKSRWGSFEALRDHSDEAVRRMTEALAAQHPAAGTDDRKVLDYDQAFLDTAAIDAAGLAPLAASWRELDAVTDVRTLLVLMGHWQNHANLPLRVDAQPDDANPGVYAPLYRQAGLGLPDRDYYLGDDARFVKARAAYETYVTALLRASGDAQAVSDTTQVIALEHALAEVQWARVDNRDPKKTYNPKTPQEMAQTAPGVDWPTFAAAAALPAGSTVVLSQPSYVTALAGLLATQPLHTWKLYLRVHRLDAMAPVLPAAFRDASFEFRGRALQGLQQQRPRWQLAVNALDSALGEATGRLYVAQVFPPEAKARAQALVANLLRAYAQSIDQLTWMSPGTKVAAHAKLAKYDVKIGYPDKWRDYSRLAVHAGDAFGNLDRADAFEYARRIVRVGRPVDRTEWGMTPQTVNAYYSPNKNEIVFPAAILQPPFFDVTADDAVNYGAIGAVIGHEISHGFDDQGSQFDGDGRLRDWWTPSDRQAFDAIVGRLADQYSAYEPISGKHLNGRLTLGENIADLSGLQIAYKAYEISLGGAKPPVIDGYTGEQRFYYGWAQIWREKAREERVLQNIVTDPHSPGRFRADGAAVNSDGFQQAFGVKPGDGMWKAPEDRIRLW
ncbi:MAG TPA: M13 family metallopeptidase [Burkholderiaceae bacterium]|nr:M13 family metallopeptidase [Burkholderiaceae bacterium]